MIRVVAALFLFASSFFVVPAATAGSARESYARYAQIGQSPAWPPRQPAPSGGTGWCGLIPQSGLVNCWPFDTAHTSGSTATDVIGGSNATLTNVTLNGSGPSTNLNNAGVFNGSSSTALTALTGLPTAAFSLVMWVNPVSLPGGVTFAANDNPGNNGFRFYVSTNFTQILGNGTTNSTAFQTLSGPPLSTWTMYSITYNGTAIQPYINSSASGTGGVLTGPVVNGGGDLLGFGYNSSYNGDYWNGLIAGIAVYNRALTSGEVTTINGL